MIKLTGFETGKEYLINEDIIEMVTAIEGGSRLVLKHSEHRVNVLECREVLSTENYKLIAVGVFNKGLDHEKK